MMELPNNWEPIKLGDVTELVYGKGLTKKVRNHDGNYPVYGSNGIVDYHDAFLVEGPVIVVGRKGAAGIPTFSTDSCWPIDTTYYIQESSVYDLKFMYYLLLSLRLHQFDRSTAIPGLNRDDAYALDIGLPPHNEQKRIVTKIEELFSELDKGIESLKTAREQLKIYRQAVLKHAFEGKLTANWREENKDKLETAGELLERIKHEREAEAKKLGKKKLKEPRQLSDEDFSWLSSLPTEWRWDRLGWMTCGIEYGTGAKSSKSGDVPVLRMGNIQNMKFDWSDLVFSSDPQEISDYLLKTDDVLFNRTNSPEWVGKTAIFKGERPAIFAGYLMRVNQINSIVDAHFLNFYLNSHTAKQYGNKVKTDGVNQSNINGEKLAHYPFPYCPLEEQRLIVDLLEEQMSLIDRTETDIDFQLQKSEALRQSILKQAFSGKLVAQDTNDEPASVLLERIKAEKENTTSKKRNAA